MTTKGADMETLRTITTVEQDGEIRLSNLPLKRGQRIELLVRTKAMQTNTLSSPPTDS